MSSSGRDQRDLARLAGILFSRDPREERAPRPSSASAGRSGAVAQARRLVPVMGCPPHHLSLRTAASLTLALSHGGAAAGLLEVGERFDDALPVPRAWVPAGSWAGAPPRLEGVRLREVARRMSPVRTLVVHLAGADGPLQRALALAATRAVLVPALTGASSGKGLQEALRACLEGSHRLRVGVVGRGGASEPSGRVSELPELDGQGGPGLPPAWSRWLEAENPDPGPVLDRPWRAVRLMSVATR